MASRNAAAELPKNVAEIIAAIDHAQSRLLVEKWARKKIIEGRTLGSIYAQATYMRAALNAIGKPPSLITPDDIACYIEGLLARGRKSSYAAVHRKALGRILPRVIMDEVPRPKASCGPVIGPDDVLTPDEVYRIIQHMPSLMLQTAAATVYDSAGRSNEVLALRVRDVDEKDDSVLVRLRNSKLTRLNPSGEPTRTMPLERAVPGPALQFGSGRSLQSREEMHLSLE